MSDPVFVLLFRGINVGGNKIVRMETLREVLTGAGFGNVATYIQSGNVVLTSDKDEAESVALIEKAFTETFGFSSRPTIRSREAWLRIVEENPYAAMTQDGRLLHAVLLDGAPSVDSIVALRALATTEQIALGEDVLYLYVPDGFGQSKVAEAFDKMLKVPLTVRNWNTVLKLREMAEGVLTT